MAYGHAIIANGTPENREVLGDGGVYYECNDFTDLAAQIDLVCSQKVEIAEMRKRAQTRARDYYSWDRIADLYEKLFYEMKRR